MQESSFGSSDSPPDAGPYARLLRALEGAARLDQAVETADPVAHRLVARPAVRGMLHGDATGIPLHVILTDVPFGAWFMAQYLDLFRDAGSRQAATRLVGLGVLAAAPTAITGWAEWALADRPTKRVGVVHAAANAVATLVFVGSWAARIRAHHDLGIRLARLGGLLLVIGGFLGGHMRSAPRYT